MAITDAFSDVLRTYWANVQLLVDLRRGGYNDLSSNARTVTLTNGASPAQPQTRTRGKGLDMGGIVGNGGYLSVPTAAALDLRPSGTILVFVRSEKAYAAGCRLAYKRNVGVSCAYDMYDATGAGVLTLFDGATAHALGSFSWPTARMVGASFTAGAAPWGYANGVRLTPPATLWAPSADATSVILPGPGGLGLPGVDWLTFVLLNTRLSGQEIMQVYSDWDQSAFSL